jgi:hypothetical protein
MECVIMLCNVLESGKVRCFDYCENREVETLKEVEDYLTVSRVTVRGEENDWEFGYTHIHYT